MKLDLQRTIVAVSSGLAAARRAIVRISGAETGAILLELVDERSCSGGRYRLASATSAVCHAVSIDIGWRVALPALVYYWPDARSFTGEPCAELHILGALPLVEALVERIVALGATPAQRGEFTLRSFLAGKLDLTQAEAVLAVIEADSKSQLELALQQLAGNLSVPVRELRSQLVELIARLEAGLDFVEEDIEFISTEQLRGGLQAIAEQLEMISARLLSRGTRGRNARIVLVGRPNAGKSSLFNALVGKERVIVSPQAGTTRDAVAQAVLLGNLNVELIDTAGIEALHDFSPRSTAQATLEARLRQADMAIFCIDLSASPSDEWVRQQTNRLRQLVPNVLLVGTKADLVDAREITAASLAKPIEQRWTATVSPFVPESIESFRDDLLAALAESRHALQTDAMHETAIRCRGSLELARAAILRALGLVAEFAGEELVAAELRLALEELSAVIGEVHTEDILGEIFGRFCIGK